ncbi:MAG: hypothetical protein IJU53_04000 [Thermoguttaceae bacterium]|nr:hypothetical protein [Thermoguttaceae bacterium]
MNHLKLVGFTLALFFYFACWHFASGASVSGPETAESGRLVIFEADTAGAFLVIPAKGADIAIDSNGQKLYLVGQKKGTYTVVFTAIEDGKIAQVQKDITIGQDLKPEPEPEPEPEPNIDDDETTLKGAITKAVGELETTKLDVEKKALIGAFQMVVDGIEEKTITAAEDARATLRIAWQTAAIKISPDVVKRWRPVLDVISEGIDTSTLAGMETGCKEVIKILEGAKAASPCQNGQCPTRTTRGFYWR